MTEDSLIDAIAQLSGRPSRVLVGIGDDAAVWQPSRSARSVITTDALIEDVHFSRAWMSLADIGYRAMAANVSDVAAMGAHPRLSTIALGIPAEIDGDAVIELYRGMDECAKAFGFQIAGGDLTRAPVLAISVTLVGEVRPAHVRLRSGAKPGDVLAVTGVLGASRAGLDLLRGAITLGEADAAAARAAHARPQARALEGRWLAGSEHVRAMMDCSDGLSTDLARMMRASRAGARVEQIPVAAAAAAAAAQLGEDAQAYAAAGGEDFELLVAIRPRAFAHLALRFAKRFGRPLERIGRVRADAGVVMVKQGEEEPMLPTGWDHFLARGTANA